MEPVRRRCAGRRAERGLSDVDGRRRTVDKNDEEWSALAEVKKATHIGGGEKERLDGERPTHSEVRQT